MFRTLCMLACLCNLAHWSAAWGWQTGHSAGVGASSRLVASYEVQKWSDKHRSTTVTKTSTTSLAWQHLTSSRCCWLRMTSFSLGCQCVSFCLFCFKFDCLGRSSVTEPLSTFMTHRPQGNATGSFPFRCEHWVRQVANTFNAIGLTSCHVLSTCDSRLPLNKFYNGVLLCIIRSIWAQSWTSLLMEEVTCRMLEVLELLF